MPCPYDRNKIKEMFKDKGFKKWWDTEIKKDFAKTQYDKIK